MQVHQTISTPFNIGYTKRLDSVGFSILSRCIHLVWINMLVFLLQSQAVLAQMESNIVQSTYSTDSTNGYWRLGTQAASRSTQVRFFGSNGQLLYEETLPEKWIKLTRKNQRHFDQLLTQLVYSQLLTARIKTKSLPPRSPQEVHTNVTNSDNSNASSYLVYVYINEDGKLSVLVNNPKHLRYAIRILDHNDRSLYEEFTNMSAYRRKMDVSLLPNDFYQVIVEIDHKPLVYRVSRQDKKVTYHIQALSTDKPAIVQGHQKENSLSFPVTCVHD